MNKNHQAKQLVVEEIKGKIEQAKSIALVDYKGISVADDTKLRASFRQNGAEYRVYKNRMLIRAFNELGISGCEEFLNGTTAIGFGYEDEIIAPKLIVEGAEKAKKIVVKCGVYQGKLISEEQVKHLAKIPPKPILISQLLSVLNGPISGLARALDAVAKKS